MANVMAEIDDELSANYASDAHLYATQVGYTAYSSGVSEPPGIFIGCSVLEDGWHHGWQCASLFDEVSACKCCEESRFGVCGLHA